MKNTEIAVNRLKIIYYSVAWSVVALVVYIVLTIVLDIDNARYQFNKGFEEGGEQGDKEYVGMFGKAEKMLFSDFWYSPPIGMADRVFEIVNTDSLRVEAGIQHFNLKVETNGMMVRPPIWKFLNALLGFCTFVAFVWWFVLAVRLFICMGRSIRRKDIFNAKLIGLHRWFAIMMIIAFTLYRLVDFVDRVFVSKYLEGTEWQISLDLPIPYTIILIGVVFYIISEILKMGYILKEEQELTI